MTSKRKARGNPSRSRKRVRHDPQSTSSSSAPPTSTWDSAVTRSLSLPYPRIPPSWALVTPCDQDFNEETGDHQHHYRGRIYLITFKAKTYLWPYHWLPDHLMNVQHPLANRLANPLASHLANPLASQQQSFTISVHTGGFSTLTPPPSFIKDVLVDLSRMAYVLACLGMEQISLQLVKGFNDLPAEIYWTEQQKFEFIGDAWFEAFVAVNHPLQTAAAYSASVSNLTLSRGISRSGFLSLLRRAYEFSQALESLVSSPARQVRVVLQDER